MMISTCIYDLDRLVHNAGPLELPSNGVRMLVWTSSNISTTAENRVT